jgi:hypothetical protein
MSCPKAFLHTHVTTELFSSSFFKVGPLGNFDKQTITTKTTNYLLTLIIRLHHMSSIVQKCVYSSPWHTFFCSHQLPLDGTDTQQPGLPHLDFLSHGTSKPLLWKSLSAPKSPPTSHAIHKFSFLDCNSHAVARQVVMLEHCFGNTF